MQGQTDLPEDVAFDIEKDVNRTFPEVARCASTCGRGLAQLCTLLLALSLPLKSSRLAAMLQVCNRQGRSEPHERAEGLCSAGPRGWVLPRCVARATQVTSSHNSKDR
jgi:hypothetical protein